MELQLRKHTTIGEVKQQFAKLFPYLKLEVFSRPAASRGGSQQQLYLHHQLCLAQVKTVWREGCFTFPSSISALDFETQLRQQFGLSVEVLCRLNQRGRSVEQPKLQSLKLENAREQAACRPVWINAATLFL